MLEVEADVVKASLPIGLQTLTLASTYQNLEKVTLPSGPQNLVNVALPSGLQALAFGYVSAFDQSSCSRLRVE